MFSEPFANIPLSLCIGSAIGVGDAVGFLVTARSLFLNPKPNIKFVAAVVEIFRLLLLAAVIIFVTRYLKLSLWWTLLPAISVSMLAKVYFILKKLRA